MKTPKTWAALLITGKDLDITRISNLLNIDPNFSHSPGENPNNKDIGYWQLNSTLNDSEIIENHLWDLLKKLAPVRNQLKEIHKEFEIHFYCSVEFSNSGIDSLKLGPRLLSLIGNLGVSLEITRWAGKELQSTDISLL
ncbi:MAG: DUF4279 domain-containing protein [Leptospiraceae bacterium]|nr:DUF4279 domain-containing protein [Leptospiraceae bacterium]